MAISAIGSLLGAAGLGSIAPVTDSTRAASGVAEGSKAVGNSFTQALDSLQGVHDNADALAVQAATGTLTDIHNYTIAATEAQLVTELTTAVRDKAVGAFNEIMRMQV
jgi:flagellar hook-basal body complex protein FliE